MSEPAENFQLDSNSFRVIADIAYRESGLALAEAKASMVQSRLRHRLRDLGIQEFSEYCELIASNAGAEERVHFISALTTNVSHFFREQHHFDILSQYLEQQLDQLREGKRLRIWSAGCSNGQEPISIAMTILEAVPDADSLDIRILGTDIDHCAIQFARQGVYDERMLNGVSVSLREKYFDQLPAPAQEPSLDVSARVKSMVKYNQLNLLSSWPMARHFDLIFCRNVVIYFDQKTQNDLWPAFHDKLPKDGLLFLGHSERIAEPDQYGFEGAGPTTYRRF